MGAGSILIIGCCFANGISVEQCLNNDGFCWNAGVCFEPWVLLEVIEAWAELKVLNLFEFFSLSQSIFGLLLGPMMGLSSFSSSTLRRGY